MLIKQVVINGQRIELYYCLETRTWCSRIADVITMRKRKQELEKHIKTIASRIYWGRLKDKFGVDSEDYFDIHISIGQ
mgnify:CR=1 FL=1